MSDLQFLAAVAVGMGTTIWAVSAWIDTSPNVRIRDADGERELKDINAPISQRNQHHASRRTR